MLVTLSLPVSHVFDCIPLAGCLPKRFVLVTNDVGVLPLSEVQHLEWSLLDVVDWLSLEFDDLQTPKIVRCWLHDAGLEQIEVLKAEHLVGRGTLRYASRH
jgi:hypothetical protein